MNIATQKLLSLDFWSSYPDDATVKNLIATEVDVEAKNEDGLTPLHRAAAKYGTAETVIALIIAGADVNAADKYGWTPLHIASWNGTAETVIALIIAGADTTAMINIGCTPAELAQVNPDLRGHNVLELLAA